MYKKELTALKKAGRFRQRKVWNKNLIDFASNDYLGLANNKKQLQKALALLNEYETMHQRQVCLLMGIMRFMSDLSRL